MWWFNLTSFLEWQVKAREERTDPDVPRCPRSRLQVTWWLVNLDLHVFLFLELLQTAVSNRSDTGPALWLWMTLERKHCHQQAMFIDLCNPWDVLSILYMQGINFVNKAFIYFYACHNWLFIELWNIWFIAVYCQPAEWKVPELVLWSGMVVSDVVQNQWLEGSSFCDIEKLVFILLNQWPWYQCY